MALDQGVAQVSKIARALMQLDLQAHKQICESLESLIEKVGLQSDVHALAADASRDGEARCQSRLSPGFEDADKAFNRYGDLIIWREILACSRERRAKAAVLLSNDEKRDWVYVPSSVKYQGRLLDGTNESVSRLKLPKPDLEAEFARTAGGQFHVWAVSTVVGALSSPSFGSMRIAEFRHLARATQVARSPTEEVVDWFLWNPERYAEAVKGVCYWESTPAEVDQSEFKAWTIAAMRDIKAARVDWDAVFLALFL